MRREVSFLGHVVSGKGARCDPKKVEAVRNMRAPSNLGELCSFLCFVGYYRHFVKGFADLAAPMYQLLKKETLSPGLVNDSKCLRTMNTF